MIYTFNAPGVYTVEVFCQNQKCSARQSEITFKLYNDKDIAVLNKAALRCSLCLEPMAPHWVKDAHQQHTAKLESSISVVNAQLYAREERAKGADLVAIPIGIWITDLPTTWKAVRTAEPTQ